MRELPEPPLFGPEMAKPDSANLPEIKAWRSIAKAVSWRTVGSLDTLLLSYLMITYVGPLFGLKPTEGEALEAAGFIAVTEIITKTIFYYFHERFWARLRWGTSVVSGKRTESYVRSTVKTVTFRTIASLDTLLLAWFFTGNLETALSIGGLEIFTKLTLYFFHERIWARVPFGIVHAA